MNRPIARALFLDAYYQVLDNKVFRLLVLISIVLIAPAFLIGFREEGIELLYGWKSFTYHEFFSAFGVQIPDDQDVQVQVIQGLQTILVGALGGLFGISFCLAATAFFVPRMLDKGAADTLFTKPVSRVVLLLSRYFAGLLFVAALSFLLVLGIHAGLLLVSGYSDPGFLWNAVSLVYVYALIQTVSILIGVTTRSSVAAILGTLLFFMTNGCIQGIWVAKEWGGQRRESDTDSDFEERRRAVDTTNAIFVLLGRTIDVLHYTLPKTHDADVLTEKLRTIVVRPPMAVRDEATKLVVEHHPEGFALTTQPGSVDLLAQPATWVAHGSDGKEESRITLSRRSRTVERPASRPGEKPRTSKQSRNQASEEFAKSLAERSGVRDTPVKETHRIRELSYDFVQWREDGSDGAVDRVRAFLVVSDWMVGIDVQQRAGAASETAGVVHRTRRFLRELRVAEEKAEFQDAAGWYKSRFGWTAPLKFNAFFSLFSSIAFAILAFGAAVWRLGRTDF